MLPANYESRPVTQIEPARPPSARHLAGTAARFTGALLAGGLIAAAAYVLLFLALGTLVFSPVAGLGLPFLAVMTWFVRPLAALERLRVRWVTGAPVAEAYRPLRGSLLAHGIHPPVLTERGLGAAVEALALASAVPVEVNIQLEQRLAAPLESALYFVIAEALANVARHSSAAWAFVRLWREQGRLRLMVHDDGHGGADPVRGSGLRGIQQRLAAIDGSTTLTSPPGGPTELFAELPCRQ